MADSVGGSGKYSFTMRGNQYAQRGAASASQKLNLEMDGAFERVWSKAVRDGIAAGIHPAPCSLYLRSNGSDSNLASGEEVMLAAKVALGLCPLDSQMLGSAVGFFGWDIFMSATVLVQIV